VILLDYLKKIKSTSVRRLMNTTYFMYVENLYFVFWGGLTVCHAG
jgi:hypothetical protein